jgi:glutamate racemase
MLFESGRNGNVYVTAINSVSQQANLRQFDVGVIDSGVGGLAVAREIQNLDSSIQIGYFADTAVFPYGDKNSIQVADRIDFLATKFVEAGTRLLVIACNTGSSAGLTSIRRKFARASVQIVGMEPPLKPAAIHSRNKSVAVVATSGTVAGQALTNLRDRVATDTTTKFIVASGLASSIERGELTSKDLDSVLQELLNLISSDGVDSVALGCSHYSFVYEEIREVLPDGVKLFDAALPVAKRTLELWTESRSSDNVSKSFNPISVFVTGDPAGFVASVARLETAGCMIPMVSVNPVPLPIN